ncbi:MAG: capsular biosynthesis protein [Phycisphaerae bacterium]|nr:capsular biosynthesis protein [Phycisphaerae bacterium]
MIVFPMAGRSRRFTAAGYVGPKYRLLAHGRPLLWHAVHGFRDLFRDEVFLFASLAEDRAEGDVRAVALSCGLTRWHLVELERPTEGQADTVQQAIDAVDASKEDPLTIFNIDTIHLRYARPAFFDLHRIDGYLETFHGLGEQWSFVVPADGRGDRVSATTEKRRVSDECCTGLYYFRRVGDFREAVRLQALGHPLAAGAGERYVAPLFNLLISWGRDVRFDRIKSNRVVFSGIPAEYEAFRDGPWPVDDH